MTVSRLLLPLVLALIHVLLRPSSAASSFEWVQFDSKLLPLCWAWVVSYRWPTDTCIFHNATSVDDPSLPIADFPFKNAFRITVTAVKAITFDSFDSSDCSGAVAASYTKTGPHLACQQIDALVGLQGGQWGQLHAFNTGNPPSAGGTPILDPSSTKSDSELLYWELYADPWDATCKRLTQVLLWSMDRCAHLSMHGQQPGNVYHTRTKILVVDTWIITEFYAGDACETSTFLFFKIGFRAAESPACTNMVLFSQRSLPVNHSDWRSVVDHPEWLVEPGNVSDMPNYMVARYHARDDCVGEPRASAAWPLNRCVAYAFDLFGTSIVATARLFANESHYLVHGYMADEVDMCESDASPFLRLGSRGESCLAGSSDVPGYWYNLELYDSLADLGFQHNMHLLRVPNCGAVDPVQLAESKKSWPTGIFFNANPDTCLNPDTPFVDVEDGVVRAYRGQCLNGAMKARNYTLQNTCENWYTELTDDFCDGFYHFTCWPFWCYGFSMDDTSNVCSGHGNCVEWDRCVCTGNYKGAKCEVAPPPPEVLSWAEENPGAVAAIIVMSIIGAVLLAAIILIVIVVCVITTAICKKMKHQTDELDRFKQMEDFDFWASEAEADKDCSTAHLRINKSMFTVDLSEIKVHRKIGCGGSDAAVYRAEWRGLEVAFKCFKTESLFKDQDNYEQFETEVSILASLKYPFVLSFYALKPPRVGIVMEFCANGDLKAFMIKHLEEKHDPFPLEKRIRWAWEIASSMAFCHCKNIIHRDLKCENVLITENLETRLMDFGLSKMVSRHRNSATVTRLVGTSQYMAPEMVKGEGEYNEKCDVYSYAILLYELITDDFSPYGTSTMNIEFKVASDPEFRPQIASDQAKAAFAKCSWLPGIVEAMWAHDPVVRPPFTDVVEILTDHL